jgi:hypothetical protein
VQRSASCWPSRCWSSCSSSRSAALVSARY